MRTQGEGDLRPAVRIGGGLFHREPAAELTVAEGDSEGHDRSGEEVAVLISHFHHPGTWQYCPRGALLAIA